MCTYIPIHTCTYTYIHTCMYTCIKHTPPTHAHAYTHTCTYIICTYEKNVMGSPRCASDALRSQLGSWAFSLNSRPSPSEPLRCPCHRWPPGFCSAPRHPTSPAAVPLRPTGVGGRPARSPSQSLLTLERPHSRVAWALGG